MASSFVVVREVPYEGSQVRWCSSREEVAEYLKYLPECDLENVEVTEIQVVAEHSAWDFRKQEA